MGPPGVEDKNGWGPSQGSAEAHPLCRVCTHVLSVCVCVCARACELTISTEWTQVAEPGGQRLLAVPFLVSLGTEAQERVEGHHPALGSDAWDK